MIERYTLPEMGKIWSIDNEWRTILNVELAACDAMAELGEIPAESAKNIRAKANFTVERIKEIEAVTDHDIIAFLTNVAEYVGEDSKFVHKGLTSSDVKDTAYCLMMKQSAEIIIDDLKKFREVLRRRAVEFKHTPCIGRTHGTYSNINPKIEELVCKKLDLQPARLATQVIQRDRHAEYMTTLAIVASTLEKIATEIRNLQRTDIREAEEYFQPGQKGSSAMPHKRNPINCERVAGMARLVRGNALASLENITLWHERDISHSSVERVILPDSTINVDYCTKKITKIIDKLLVYPDAMLHNMNRTGGLIYSQRIMLAIVGKGVLREDAYKWVQRNAMKRWLEKEDFKTNIENDEDIKKYLTKEEIENCFDYTWFLRNVDMIFERFGL